MLYGLILVLNILQAIKVTFLHFFSFLFPKNNLENKQKTSFEKVTQTFSFKSFLLTSTNYTPSILGSQLSKWLKCSTSFQLRPKTASAFNCLHPPLLQCPIKFYEKEEGYKLITACNTTQCAL